jgi:cold shock CspA family protein
MDNANKRHMGQVKWFNNKTGYGFITVIGESEYTGKDIFTHYSAVRVSNAQYKYLTQGEYVECMVVKTENGKHEFQSADITGICGGALMCETRNNVNTNRGQQSLAPGNTTA